MKLRTDVAVAKPLRCLSYTAAHVNNTDYTLVEQHRALLRSRDGRAEFETAPHVIMTHAYMFLPPSRNCAAVSMVKVRGTAHLESVDAALRGRAASASPFVHCGGMSYDLDDKRSHRFPGGKQVKSFPHDACCPPVAKA